ncbi:MAG TPA: hypothetical protein VHB49_05385 [Bradyrhizobium sp.]|nr:hypothetical protein [Bradyrhizobium sp.]
MELAFATLAPPLAWSVHLVASYALASYSCFPDGTPQASPSFDGLRSLLIAIDIVTMAIAVVAIVISYWNWTKISEEMAVTQSPMMETGEGRTRFLAIWGLLIGVGFLVTVGFDFVGLWILQPCG